MCNSSRKTFCSVLASLCFGIPLVTTAQAQLTIMPLGDSITAGAGDPNYPGGYRAPLYQDLTGQGYNFQFVGSTSTDSSTTLTAAGDAYHNGYGSYTIGNLYSNLAGSYQPDGADNNEGGYWLTGGGGTGRAASDPNVVLLMAGTNDINQGESLSVMEANMTSLLGWFQLNRPTTTMIIGTVIPRGNYGAFDVANYQALNDEAIAFNSWLTSYAPTVSSEDHVVDMYDLFVTTPGSDTAVKTSSSPDGIYLYDGAHPSPGGYDAIANAWDDAIAADVPVPEPSTWALLLGGMTGLFFLGSRRFRIHSS